jgi:VWFA-related protein
VLANSPEQPQFTIRSNTRLVEVHVVVVDKQGHPVPGLTRQDFEVTDEGQRQELVLCRMEQSTAVPTDVRRVAPPGPTAVTNRTTGVQGQNAATIILFDPLTLRWEETAYAKIQLAKFLESVQPSDQIAILEQLLGGLRVLRDFSQDATDLTRFARRSQSQPGDPAAESKGSGLEDWGASLARWFRGRTTVPQGPVRSSGYCSDLTECELKSLIQIANYVAVSPGRKNLLWITGGVSYLGTSVHGVFDSHFELARVALRALTRANVAVYPVDARGLLPGVLDASYSAAERNPALRFAGPEALRAQTAEDAAAEAGRISANQGPLLEFADHTGGRAFINTNDVLGAMQSAFTDASAIYTLAFYPQSQRLDGSFRKLRVKLVTRPELTVRYRSGYWDAPISGDVETELREATWSPLDATGIGLTATSASASPGTLDLQVSVDVSALSLEQNGARRKGRVRIVVVQSTDDQEQVNFSDETLGLELRAETYQRMLNEGFSYRRVVRLSPRATRLRVVVIDPSSGRIGSLYVPFSPARD